MCPARADGRVELESIRHAELTAGFRGLLRRRRQRSPQARLQFKTPSLQVRRTIRPLARQPADLDAIGTYVNPKRLVERPQRQKSDHDGKTEQGPGNLPRVKVLLPAFRQQDAREKSAYQAGQPHEQNERDETPV